MARRQGRGRMAAALLASVLLSSVLPTADPARAADEVGPAVPVELPVRSAFGNLTGLPGEGAGAASTTLAYDLADHLVGLDGPTEPAVSFGIDALGRSRTRQVGAGTVESLLYVGTGDAVVRIGGASTPVDAALDPAGTRLASRQAAGSPSFLLPDLHGNVAALWDQAAAGFGATFRYDPYGELISSPPGGSTRTPWRYQGRLLEGEPGDPELYDFGFRSYAPDIGAFASLDSVAGGAQDVLSLNRFLYANANPTTLIDPTGHFVFLALLAPILVGAVIGGATDAVVQQATTGTIDWGGVAVSGAIGGASGGVGAAAGSLARSALSSIARPAIANATASVAAATGGAVADVAGSSFAGRDDMTGGDIATGAAAGVAGDAAFEGAKRLAGRWGKLGDLVAPLFQKRDANDVAVTGLATPHPLELARPIGNRLQNADKRRLIDRLDRDDARDIRVNQEQVNLNGARVGVNRPDVQATTRTLLGRVPLRGKQISNSLYGTRFRRLAWKREYWEWDRNRLDRWPGHRGRIIRNDRMAWLYGRVHSCNYRYRCGQR